MVSSSSFGVNLWPESWSTAVVHLHIGDGEDQERQDDVLWLFQINVHVWEMEGNLHLKWE